MSASRQDGYALPRDARESKRLDLQHQFAIERVGFHVHPTISIGPDTPDLRIADVACGSGIWLTEVAEKFPNAECHGFDISPAQFPPQAELDQAFDRGRVRFHVQDMSSETGPAPEHRAAFDVVAVRLICIGLMGEGWNRAVRNLVAMLKPGGYVQWIDHDLMVMKIVQHKPLAKKAAMEELHSGFKVFLATRDTGGVSRLRDLLHDNGITDILTEWYSTGESPNFVQGSIAETWPGIIRRTLVGKEDSGWTEDRIARIERQVREEVDAAEAFWRFDIQCIVARKTDEVKP